MKNNFSEVTRVKTAREYIIDGCLYEKWTVFFVSDCYNDGEELYSDIYLSFGGSCGRINGEWKEFANGTLFEEIKQLNK